MPKKKLLPLKKPVRIGFLAFLADQGGCGILRTVTPYLLLNHLKIPKIPIHASYFSQYISDANFYKNFSFIQFQRSATEQHLKIHRDFRQRIQTKHKVPLVYEIDDLLMGIPKWNFAYQYYKENVHHIEAMMRESNAIVTSTHPLKKVYSKYNKNIKVVPNHLAKFIWGEIQPKHEKPPQDKIRILWAGSQNHFKHESMKGFPDGGDFGSKLMEFIKKTTDIYEWVFMGALPIELNDIKDKVEFHEWKNTYEYPHYLKGLNADMGIAPLQKGLFNDCKCIVGSSLIPTSKGIKKLKNVVKERTNKLCNFNRIINYVKYDKQKTVKITTNHGYQLEGSNTHRIKNDKNKWVSLKNLSIGDKLKLYPFSITQSDYQYMTYPMLLTKKIKDDVIENLDDSMSPRIVVNEDWGRLFGYLIGDGYYNTGNSVAISCDDRYADVVEDIHDLFKKIGLRTSECYKINSHAKDKHITRPHGVDVKANSKTLRLMLFKYGFAGRNGKILEIPKIIMNSPQSVIREFIRGLFEADGTVSVSHSSCYLVTKSEVLARQVQFVLLGFGIKSKVSNRLNKEYKKYYWSVYLSRESTDLFFKKIRFFSKRKNARLEKVKNKSHSNRFKKYDWIEEIVDIKESVNDVFDVEILKTHQYLSNGFCNHNSSIKAQEFTAAGIPGIYSNVSPYHLLKTKCDTEEYMIDRIETLAKDIEMRAKAWEHDYNVLKENLWWEENDNLKKYVKTYLSIIGRKIS